MNIRSSMTSYSSWDHSIKDMDVEDLTKEERPRSGRVETWDEGLYEILDRTEGK